MCRGLGTLGDGLGASSFLSAEAFGLRRVAARLAVEPVGVDANDREEVRGSTPGRVGSAGPPVVRLGNGELVRGEVF